MHFLIRYTQNILYTCPGNFLIAQKIKSLKYPKERSKKAIVAQKYFWRCLVLLVLTLGVVLNKASFYSISVVEA